MATAETPTDQSPAKSSLAAVFDQAFKIADEVVTNEEDQNGSQEPEKKPEPATPPPDTATPAAEPEKKPEEKKPEDDFTSLLAPDFSDPTVAPPVSQEDHPQITDEMIEATPGEKGKADMRRFRENYNKVINENRELRQKADNGGVSNEVVVQLQGENKELLERIERINLIESPRFQAEKIMPRKKIYDQAVELLTEAEIDPTLLAKAMPLRGRARADVMDEITEGITSNTMQKKFLGMVDRMDEMTDDINQALSNARLQNEELRKKDTIERHQNGEKSVAEMRNLLAAQSSRLSTEIEFLKKSSNPNHTQWNNDIEQVHKVAEHILLNASPEEAATSSLLAPMALMVLKYYRHERNARKAAEKALAERDGASPSIQPDRSRKPVSGVTDDMDITQAVLAGLKNRKKN